QVQYEHSALLRFEHELSLAGRRVDVLNSDLHVLQLRQVSVDRSVEIEFPITSKARTHDRSRIGRPFLIPSEKRSSPLAERTSRIFRQASAPGAGSTTRSNRDGRPFTVPGESRKAVAAVTR